MLPQNTVDAFAFWIVTAIFAVIMGNLIYESIIVQWLLERQERCKAVCCIEGEEDE